MKKFLAFILIYTAISCCSAISAVINLSTDGEYQEYINKTGFKILNYNEISQHIIFKYSSSDDNYSYYNSEDMSVIVPKGVLTHIESEDELAAAIAPQIAYCLLYKENSFARWNIKMSPKKYETYTDKRAVDMLVKANYSPIASITLINKMYGENKKKLFQKHVKTSIRLAQIYEYIMRKYPYTLDNLKFSRNVYYQNFLLNSRNNRAILQNKLRQEANETKKYE